MKSTTPTQSVYNRGLKEISVYGIVTKFTKFICLNTRNVSGDVKHLSLLVQNESVLLAKLIFKAYTRNTNEEKIEITDLIDQQLQALAFSTNLLYELKVTSRDQNIYLGELILEMINEMDKWKSYLNKKKIKK